MYVCMYDIRQYYIAASATSHFTELTKMSTIRVNHNAVLNKKVFNRFFENGQGACRCDRGRQTVP